MFPKSTLTFLATSLALHTLFAVSSHLPSFLPQSEDENLVQIEYIQSRSSPVASEEKKAAKTIAEKSIEIVAKPKETPPMRRIEPVQEAPIISKPAVPAEKAKPKTEWQPVYASLPAPKPAAIIRRSEDLLADPHKGKIFAGYFARIKEKIQHTVQQKYAYENVGRGTVTLLFVLDSNGVLENVSVSEKASIGSGDVNDFAMRCVRESAPFGRFPKDLNLNKISFNLTVLFQEV